MITEGASLLLPLAAVSRLALCGGGQRLAIWWHRAQHARDHLQGHSTAQQEASHYTLTTRGSTILQLPHFNYNMTKLWFCVCQQPDANMTCESTRSIWCYQISFTHDFMRLGGWAPDTWVGHALVQTSYVLWQCLDRAVNLSWFCWHNAVHNQRWSAHNSGIH